MKIDFVITELNAGGAEQALARIATGLARRGDEVRVFSCGPLPKGGSDPDNPDRLQSTRIVDQLREAQIEITSGHGASAWQLPRVYSALKAWLNQRPADVCQSFLVHANILAMHALARHAPAPHERSRNGAAGPVRVAGIRVAESKPVRLWAERRALSRADHVVCVSDAVAEFTRSSLRVDESRTSVIPNAVDVARFRDAQPFQWTKIGWPADAEVILFVGRLHPQKNLALLQEHFEEIVRQPSQRRLLLIGDGPQADEMRQWASRVGGPDRSVQILPWQTDIAPMMAACRVLVLPSHYEGMPNVVLEAMATGKPVVCSRVEGIAELIRESSQQSFDVGDGHEMVRCLNRYLDDEPAARETGEANQSFVAREFKIETMVDRYRELYQRLVDER